MLLDGLYSSAYGSGILIAIGSQYAKSWVDVIQLKTSNGTLHNQHKLEP